MANKISSDIILVLNQKAKELEKQGVSVLNGTIGMMFLDNGLLPVSNQIRNVLAKHTKDDDLTYSSVAGEEEYLHSLVKWFFGGLFDYAYANGKLACVGTMGGTGAISIATRCTSIDQDSILLIPEYCWPNYQSIANTFGVPYELYKMFNGTSFALTELKEQINKYKNKHIILVINDPCENPTGFCLKPNEWEEIIQIANNTPSISLIIDCAYVDFASEASRKSIISSVQSLKEDKVAYICCSFSKTFSFYGLRIGALCIYSKDKEKTKSATSLAIQEARALWSVPNHMAMNAIGELLGNKETYQELKNEVNINQQIVSKRAKLFIDEANKIGLEYLPYSFGFFISIPCKDAFALSIKLQEKLIFLAPVREDALRISLSCIPTTRIAGLATTIKTII
jgi:aspartate/tyrosine/aromatic aminotransferase